MKITLTVQQEVEVRAVLALLLESIRPEVKYLRADCGVRYWDDGEVNGLKDDENAPRMPFASSDGWAPIIDLETGKIVDWPAGTTASVHYKVCDAGRYSLLDADKAVVKTIDGYVPSMLSPKYSGYGDYVIMDIAADGQIDKWRVDLGPFYAA